MDAVAPRKSSVWNDYFNLKTVPAWIAHLGAVAVVCLYGWSWTGFGLALALYYARMFLITGGYHRYFSHRTYKTSRPFQFLLAFLGGMCAQKGALWWAAHHRVHHRTSDTELDPHSMKLRGFWWSHMGWIFSVQYDATGYKLVPDLAKYPELVWLNRHHLVPLVLYSVMLFVGGELWAVHGGWWTVGWGLAFSTVMLWHGTFSINSLSHWMGRKRFASGDESRNSLLLSLVTLGEGWHNNHHYYQSCVNQGFYWWEIDITYYILKMFSWVGLVWDLRKPPKRVLDEGRALDRGEMSRPVAEPAPAVASALSTVDIAPAE